MKTFLLITILIAAATACRAQFNCDDGTYERNIHITGGAPFNANFEAGLQWNILGFSAGIKSYEPMIKTKAGTTYSGSEITLLARGIVSIVKTPRFRWLVTGYYGFGVAGASNRMAVKMGQGDWYIMGEAGYSKEQAKFFSLGVTFNF